MKRRKAIIFKYLIAGFLAVVLAFSQYMLHNNRKAYEKMKDAEILTLDDDANVTFDMLEQMDEDYIMGGYQIAKEQKVLMAGTAKSVKTDVIIVDFPVTKLFAAVNQLCIEDTVGCIVSSHTMYKLFGTTVGIGQQLTCNGKDYLVRGIVDTEESMVIIQYDKITDPYRYLSLDGIIFDISGEMYRNQIAEKFHNAYEKGNVSDGYYTYDYTSLINGLETPVKWSDFEFWKDYGKELSDRIERKLYGDKDIVERYYFRIFVKKLKLECLFLTMCIANFIVICLAMETKAQEGKRYE